MRSWEQRNGVSRQGPRWSEAEAREALAEWRRSGGSAVAFAAARGVSPQRLAYWRKRLGASSESTAVAFAEVEPSAIGRHEIEIAYECVRVRIREEVDAKQLARIVHALTREE